jgi:hypothetical protein
MMNFIRDIIGEKRQSTGQPAAQSDWRPDDRSHMASASPRPQILQDQVEEDGDELPIADAAHDILSRTFEAGTELPSAPREEETLADPSFDIDEEDLPGDDDAVLTAPERDVYAELRSIFVAEQKDRVPEDPADLPETAALTRAAAEHEPLKAAIARVEKEYCSEDAPDVTATPPETPTADAALGDDEAWDDPIEPIADQHEPLERDPLPEPLRTRSAQVAEAAAPPMPRVEETVAVPGPAMGRGSSSKARVKTRLLGFNVDRDDDVDPISGGQAAKPAAYTKFPLGWLIVTDGPGRGAAFTLFGGVSQIGRGKNQTIPLDFGDNSISRENHAAIAYDHTQNRFFIGHGGKANLVRRNDRPVLATEELDAGDRITIGETSLRFVPLCGEDFSWQDAEEGHWSDAANG